jgi:ectoine hydroxylase-related dioxygenase (phytanoyl-CoA dioxygenase family)
MYNIFKNPDLQKQFDIDGYVLLPWLNGDEVQRLRKLYHSLGLKSTDHFDSTSFLADIDVKKKINIETETIFAEKVNTTFANIKKLGSSFLTKPIGQKGEMPVHQDWTIVDETLYCSATIWVALEDISEQNGAMQVLPGSHRFSSTLRAPTLETDYAHLQQYLRSKMTTISPRAGDAIIFNHALFHASSVNNSTQPRLAVTYGLVSEQAQLSLYIKNENGKAEQFEMPDDMFLYYNEIGTQPKFGKKINEIDFLPKSKSELYFEQKINQYISSVRGERIFKDTATQQRFDKDGYVVLPALSEAEVSELLDFYKSLHITDEKGFGFHISMDQRDKNLAGRILDKLFEVAHPKMSVHFAEAKAFVGSYVIEESNPTSVVPVHQDWSFVDDEERHSSLTCWVPLVDTNLDNGAMAVIKGSHRFFKNFRPSPSPQVPSPLSELMFTIFPYLNLIEMKAGEMLVFDNRTFHGSPPNTSSEPRIAFGLGLTQKSAKLVHYYLNPSSQDKNEVFKYAIDEGFFRKYENSKLSEMYDLGQVVEGYKLEGTLPFVLPKFTSEELIEIIKDNGNVFNVPMCEKLATLFNYKMDGTKKEEEKSAQPAAEPVQEIQQPIQAERIDTVWTDNRTFAEKYTFKNILTEVKLRLTGHV